MTSWEHEYEHLRQQYLTGADARITTIETALDTLRADVASTDALASLRRLLHSLAGTSGSFKLLDVMARAGEAERCCGELLCERRAPGATELARLGELIIAIRAGFGSEPAAVFEMRGACTREVPGERPMVLVVDDDADLAGLISAALEASGMKTAVATSRAAALDFLGVCRPQGAVVDVLLPDGTGHSLVEEMRANPSMCPSAVIMVSRLSSILDKVVSLRSGADGFFEKPLDLEALANRLHGLLDRVAGDPIRVLLVEADEAEAARLEALLRPHDFTVMVCSDPADFEGALSSFRPEIVLLDVQLPGMSGYELARFVRQHESHAALPVLLLSTDAGPSTHVAGLESGGDDLLEVPLVEEVLVSSITSRVRRARDLQSLISRDGLTRLLTRTAFLERASAIVADARRRPDRRRAMVFVDLDHFKSVNDRYGHATGDRVLTSMAMLLRRRLRQADTIGRLGGEEFAVIVDDLEEREALQLIGRLLDEFRATAQLAPGDASFTVSFSAGVAMLDATRMSVESWTAEADAALYEAKRQGRARVVAAARR